MEFKVGDVASASPAPQQCCSDAKGGGMRKPQGREPCPLLSPLRVALWWEPSGVEAAAGC